jgi:hypothetical protein
VPSKRPCTCTQVTHCPAAKPSRAAFHHGVCKQGGSTADLILHGFPSQITVAGGTSVPLLNNFTETYGKTAVAFTAIVQSYGFKSARLVTETKPVFGFRDLDCTTAYTVKGGRCVFFVAESAIPSGTYNMKMLLDYGDSFTTYNSTI